MEKYKHQRAATGFEADAGSVEGEALNEASMARRSFLGRIGRSSVAAAVFGLGADGWIQAVSRGSIMSRAMAAGATRDRQLHPFPSDDPFNMPLGVNAWYAPADDPATADFTSSFMHLTVNNGWSHPIFFPTTSDPFTTICDRGNPPRIESYRAEEHEQECVQEYLQSGADTFSSINNRDGYWDDHLHFMIDNELIETFRFQRVSANEISGGRVVRNRLDYYSFSRYGFSNPLANTAGCRAYGGSTVAGLIRKHEVDIENPHIPHAFAIAGKTTQMGSTGNGDPSSPLYNTYNMFPANGIDTGGYTHYDGTANFRMGMRFALDPAIATDSWIEANAPNKWAKAFAYAMRDYGCIVTDTSYSSNLFYGEEGISSEAETAIRNNMNFMRSAVRRVAGAGPLHNPKESDWNVWRASGHGWGGGSPRVPYSPLLSPLSPGIPPQSPGSIQVSENRRRGDVA